VSSRGDRSRRAQTGRELAHEAALAELRQKIAVGLAQARQGDLLDGEAGFEELERQGVVGEPGVEGCFIAGAPPFRLRAVPRQRSPPA
jgi:hypothetical protein